MKRCSVGGQAVMEGVMMRTPDGDVALAVRKADGTIVTEYTEKKPVSNHPALKWPVVPPSSRASKTLTSKSRVPALVASRRCAPWVPWASASRPFRM